MFSRPTYRLLDLDPSGRTHLIAGVAEGHASIARVAGQAGALAKAFTVIYDPNPDADLTECLISFFNTATMGVRVYFCGSESFIWAAVRAAAPYGFGTDEIQLEVTGHDARDVYCVHCKNVIAHVSTYTCVCTNCGTLLGVRDHFSRRLGCYMGVWELS
jgi:dimethylamine monooxygenase subunit C